MASFNLLSAAAPLAVFVIPYFLSVSAIDDPTPLQTCFDFTGRPLTNNTQCPGSNACCHYLHQCTGNRLCTQDNSPEYVNSLCAVNPWEDCSNICQYGANASGFLPRVTKCPDGSYCCDSDIKCCEKGKGIVLDGKGNIVNNSKSQASSSTSAISRQTSDSTPTASLTSFPTATPTALPSAVPNPTGLPVAAKAGIGVAVGFSLLSCVILFALYLRRRKNKADKALESKGSNDLPSDGEAWPLNGNQSTSPQEMSNSPKPQQFEMPNYSMRVELPGDTPPYPELYGSDSKPDIEKAPSRMI